MERGSRRRFLRGTMILAGLGLLAGCGVLPPRTPQPGKVWRVGFLGPTSSQPFYDAFGQGLSELGYTEGRNLAIEYRYAGGKFELLPELAAELVRLEVDVIVNMTTAQLGFVHLGRFMETAQGRPLSGARVCDGIICMSAKTPTCKNSNATQEDPPSLQGKSDSGPERNGQSRAQLNGGYRG